MKGYSELSDIVMNLTLRSSSVRATRLPGTYYKSRRGFPHLYSPPASRGFTRRGGGASITVIPAEREDSAGFYIVWVENVLGARAR